MNLHKQQLYLLEQSSESFKIWSAIIRINSEGKSSIMKLGTEQRYKGCIHVTAIMTICGIIWFKALTFEFLQEQKSNQGIGFKCVFV